MAINGLKVTNGTTSRVQDDDAKHRPARGTASTRSGDDETAQCPDIVDLGPEE